MTKQRILALRRAIIALIEAGKLEEAQAIQEAFKEWIMVASIKWV